MKTMTEQIVSYETAKTLKRAGFDWKCDHYYNSHQTLCRYANTDVVNRNTNGHHTPSCSAPSQSLAQKWLREVKDVHVYPTLESVNEVVYDCMVVHLHKDAFRLNNQYFTYEDALEAGLQAALKLIEKKGE